MPGPGHSPWPLFGDGQIHSQQRHFVGKVKFSTVVGKPKVHWTRDCACGVGCGGLATGQDQHCIDETPLAGNGIDDIAIGHCVASTIVHRHLKLSSTGAIRRQAGCIEGHIHLDRRIKVHEITDLAICIRVIGAEPVALRVDLSWPQVQQIEGEIAAQDIGIDAGWGRVIHGIDQSILDIGAHDVARDLESRLILDPDAIASVVGDFIVEDLVVAALVQTHTVAAIAIDLIGFDEAGVAAMTGFDDQANAKAVVVVDLVASDVALVRAAKSDAEFVVMNLVEADVCAITVDLNSPSGTEAIFAVAVMTEDAVVDAVIVRVVDTDPGTRILNHAVPQTVEQRRRAKVQSHPIAAAWRWVVGGKDDGLVGFTLRHQLPDARPLANMECCASGKTYDNSRLDGQLDAGPDGNVPCDVVGTVHLQPGRWYDDRSRPIRASSRAEIVLRLPAGLRVDRPFLIKDASRQDGPTQ